MDYGELEREPVVVRFDNIDVPGRVVGCDYDVGITIQHRSNKDIYLICLLGPSSPQVKKSPVLLNQAKKTYDAMFNLSVKMIKEGLYDASKCDAIFMDLCGINIRSDASAKTCAFAQ